MRVCECWCGGESNDVAIKVLVKLEKEGVLVKEGMLVKLKEGVLVREGVLVKQ